MDIPFGVSNPNLGGQPLGAQGSEPLKRDVSNQNICAAAYHAGALRAVVTEDCVLKKEGRIHRCGTF